MNDKIFLIYFERPSTSPGIPGEIIYQEAILADNYDAALEEAKKILDRENIQLAVDLKISPTELKEEDKIKLATVFEQPKDVNVASVLDNGQFVDLLRPFKKGELNNNPFQIDWTKANIGTWTRFIRFLNSIPTYITTQSNGVIEYLDTEVREVETTNAQGKTIKINVISEEVKNEAIKKGLNPNNIKIKTGLRGDYRWNTEEGLKKWSLKFIDQFNRTNVFAKNGFPITRENIIAIQTYHNIVNKNIQIDGWVGSQTSRLAYPLPNIWNPPFSFAKYPEIYIALKGYTPPPNPNKNKWTAWPVELQQSFDNFWAKYLKSGKNQKIFDDYIVSQKPLPPRNNFFTFTNEDFGPFQITKTPPSLKTLAGSKESSTRSPAINVSNIESYIIENPFNPSQKANFGPLNATWIYGKPGDSNYKAYLGAGAPPSANYDPSDPNPRLAATWGPYRFVVRVEDYVAAVRKNIDRWNIPNYTSPIDWDAVKAGKNPYAIFEIFVETTHLPAFTDPNKKEGLYLLQHIYSGPDIYANFVTGDVVTKPGIDSTVDTPKVIESIRKQRAKERENNAILKKASSGR